jgi:photosystem II stability/assembly factor-like uncharacterized protein
MLNGAAWSAVNTTASVPIGAGDNGILLVGDDGSKLGSPGTVSYSTDGGSTWRVGTGMPYDQSVEAIAGQPTSTTLFAYCCGGDIYSSVDGGRDWALVSRALRRRAG